MKIYLIKTSDCSYDGYDGIVVVAKDKKRAIEMAIDKCHNFHIGIELKTSFIGESPDKTESVILSSYNAG